MIQWETTKKIHVNDSDHMPFHKNPTVLSAQIFEPRRFVKTNFKKPFFNVKRHFKLKNRIRYAYMSNVQKINKFC